MFKDKPGGLVVDYLRENRLAGGPSSSGRPEEVSKPLPFGTVPWASEPASIEAARPPDSASPKTEKRQRWGLHSSVCGNRTWLAGYICKIRVRTVQQIQ